MGEWTNYVKIKLTRIDGLAEFIGNLLDHPDDNVITKWFDENYCKSCKKTKIVKCPECPSLVGQELNECDFEGRCPHYQTTKDLVKLFLEGEVERCQSVKF